MKRVNGGCFCICEHGFLEDFNFWNEEWLRKISNAQMKQSYAFAEQSDMVSRVRDHYLATGEVINESNFYRIMQLPFGSLSDFFTGISELRKASGLPCDNINCIRSSE